MGARRRVRVVALCAMTVGLGLMLAGSASAAFTHRFEGGFGSFSGAIGIAVEQLSGDVYVVDSNANTVYKFDSAGSPVAGWSLGAMTGRSAGGLNYPYGVAVDQASGDLYVADVNNGVVDKFESNGTFLASFSGPTGSAGVFQPSGVATDSSGNVYVADMANGVIDKFDAKGVFLATYGKDIHTGQGIFPSTNGVAVDSSGDIYATANFSQLIELDPSGDCVSSCTPIDQGSLGVAVDPSTGHVFSVDGNSIAEYDSTGSLVDRFGEGHLSFSMGVAVNSTLGHVYATDYYNPEGKADIFGALVATPDVTTGPASSVTANSAILTGTVNPNGAETTSCVFEYGGQSIPCETSPGSGTSPVEVTAHVAGLTAGTNYSYKLTASNENAMVTGTERSFMTLSAPVVGDVHEVLATWSTDVSTKRATVNAEVNPEGADTTFRFEYGLDSSYGTSIPVPDQDIGAGTEFVKVAERIDNLNSGITYHYRVVATNAIGTTYSPDKTFTTFAEPASETAGDCPNAVYRKGASALLPDCRAYEMVTPPDKNGAEVDASEGISAHVGSSKEFFAASNGERILFKSHTGFGEPKGSGEVGFFELVSSRGPGGWSTKSLLPTPASSSTLQAGLAGTWVELPADNLERVVTAGYDLPGVSGGFSKMREAYLEDTASGKLLEPIARFEGFEEPLSPYAFFGYISDASGDLGVVTFEMAANLIPQATGTARKLYALDHGKVRLVGVLPNGSIPAGGSSGVREYPYSARYKDSVSTNGKRILFTSPVDGSAEPQLYMRKNENSTVWISQPESSEPNIQPTNVKFQAASPDGTKVVFSTDSRLLDTDPGGAGTGLYLYSDSPSPETEPNLTFIARMAPVDIAPTVRGVSNDGSHIYFASEYLRGTLPFVTEGRALFLWDKGTLRQVAPVPGGDDPLDGSGDLGSVEEAEISPDGRRIVFTNRKRIANYDILGLPDEYEDAELYLYDEGTNELKCVSCPPTGAAVTTGVEMGVHATESNVGFATPYHAAKFFAGKYVFFNTPEALVPQDTNKVTDAYEYNVETGRLSLLSTGTGSKGTWFVGASSDGRDVFLATRQSLSGWDPDKLDDLYDARIGGGFPEPLPAKAPCPEDACQGIPRAAPSFNTASQFNGLGNPAWQPVKVKARARGLTRAQVLRRALRACRSKLHKKRLACEARARKRFGKARKSSVRVSRRTGR